MLEAQHHSLSRLIPNIERCLINFNLQILMNSFSLRPDYSVLVIATESQHLENHCIQWNKIREPATFIILRLRRRFKRNVLCFLCAAI